MWATLAAARGRPPAKKAVLRSGPRSESIIEVESGELNFATGPENSAAAGLSGCAAPAGRVSARTFWAVAAKPKSADPAAAPTPTARLTLRSTSSIFAIAPRKSVGFAMA
jgi:hypothetical protein